MEWVTQLIAGIGCLVAIASVWISRAQTKGQMARWERESREKQTETELQAKEAAIARADEARKWEANFKAAEERERAAVDRWMKEFERGREQIERQSVLFQRQILAQWKGLRDRPLLDHRAQCLVNFYDSLCRLHAEAEMSPIWKSMDESQANKIGRKSFDQQLAVEYLQFMGHMFAVAPYLPDAVGDAVKLAAALIARNMKIIGGAPLIASDPPVHPTDNERILATIRMVGQLLNPRSPTEGLVRTNRTADSAKS